MKSSTFPVPAAVFAVAICALCDVAAFATMPKTATIIPAPREMKVTGGECWAKKPPTFW